MCVRDHVQVAAIIPYDPAHGLLFEALKFGVIYNVAIDNRYVKDQGLKRRKNPSTGWIERPQIFFRNKVSCKDSNFDAGQRQGDVRKGSERGSDKCQPRACACGNGGWGWCLPACPCLLYRIII